MTVVKQAVERLETMEISFAPILCHVGARHAPNSKFCSDNFALFMKSMLYIWSTVLKVCTCMLFFSLDDSCPLPLP